MTDESAGKASGGKRGPKGNLQETASVPLTLPFALYRYIDWLARNSMWGPTMQDVIEKILTRDLHEMFDRGFHDKRLPETTTPQLPPDDETN